MQYVLYTKDIAGYPKYYLAVKGYEFGEFCIDKEHWAAKFSKDEAEKIKDKLNKNRTKNIKWYLEKA